ncbi:MAG: hypothetical protein ACR2MY_13760 [Candidatus Dormibacteria bacterium]
MRKACQYGALGVTLIGVAGLATERARAATPPAITADAGGSRSRSATYQGSAITGTDDGAGQLGQNFKKCKGAGPPMCEQELVHVVAPNGFEKTHTVGLTVISPPAARTVAWSRPAPPRDS